MRFLLLVSWMLLSMNILYAQCLPKGISTDFSNPINPEKPEYENDFFNWSARTFVTNSVYNPSFVTSPFHYVDNINIAHLYFNKDMRPEDGWELIKRDLGYTVDGLPETTDYIYFILYNRYTGIMRVFLAGDDTDSYNGATISISFLSGGQSKLTSLLSNTSEIFALDRFPTVPVVSSTSNYLNGIRNWFYADFHMTYDPCTCLNKSTLQIVVDLLETATITLSGNIDGKIASIENKVQGKVDHNLFTVENLSKAAKGAQKTYKSYSDQKNDLLKTAISETEYWDQVLTILNQDGTNKTPFERSAADVESLFNQVATPDIKDDYEVYKNSLNFFEQKLAASDFLKAGLKAVPYIGAAAQFLNLFIAGGKKSPPGPAQVQVMPMSINAKLSLSGEIVISKQYKNIVFSTPGSLDAELGEESYPYYNEILGVFNLLETPKLYVETDVLDSKSHHYYIKDKVKYVLNPAVGLSVQDIYVSIEASFSEPIVDDPYLFDMMNLYFKTDSKHLSTRVVPLSELKNIQIWLRNQPSAEFRLKVFVNLRRDDADESTQNILFIGAYAVDPTPSYGTPYSPPDQLNNYPNNLVINGSVTTTGAWDVLTIKNTTISSTSVREYGAGQRVEVLAGSTLRPNTILRTGLPNGNESVWQAPETSSNIISFCNSTKYNIPSRNYRQGIVTDVDRGVEIGESDVNAFPNPSNGDISFWLKLPNATSAMLSIYDLKGVAIERVFDGHGPTPESGITIPYTGRKLAPGVYVYVLETNTSVVSKKLVVR